jgi:hypothetical protein
LHQDGRIPSDVAVADADLQGAAAGRREAIGHVGMRENGVGRESGHGKGKILHFGGFPYAARADDPFRRPYRADAPDAGLRDYPAALSGAPAPLSASPLAAPPDSGGGGSMPAGAGSSK